jgi:metallo-beta-lactamase class B
VLFDGALPQSVPAIEANIRALGFQVKDIKLIVNSHAHFDHAGGIAALKADSGATVAASRDGTRALENGHPLADDPQAGFGVEKIRFPTIGNVRAVNDAETLEIGPLAITAHLTPGHTLGSTTWSFQSCDGLRCVDVVYGDSLNPISAPGFRFSGGDGYRDIGKSFTASIAKVAALPCDVLLMVHPSEAFFEKATAIQTQSTNPFIDRQSCRRYASAARHRLEVRLAQERTTSVKSTQSVPK